MGTFVQGGAVPVDRLEERLRRRDHHIVLRGNIEGAVAADTEVDAGGLDQRLDPRLDQAGFGGRRGRRDFFGEVLALRGIEDREALEERDGLRFLARLAGAPPLVLGGEAIGIDDGRAALALAHIAAEREGLAEGQPALAWKAVLDHGAPQDQHIDPGILPAGRGILRHGERRLGRRAPPGLGPGHAAALQLGHDLVGDFVIEARPG